jgi:REP element-mobilizing transposase RayT
MAHTYTSLTYHLIFSTKNRDPALTPPIRDRLWPYLGGIARENRMTALEIGGVADHVHLLLSAPPVVPISKAAQLIKGGSSHWLKSEFSVLAHFAWQDGYGAFSVSESQVETVRAYIRNQAEHHRTKTFAEEYRVFLERHHVAFDERYWLD